MNRSFTLLFFLFLFSIVFFSSNTSAQSRTTFKGTVIDESDQPLPGVTIMVLSPKDSTLIQFTSTNEQGAFIVQDVPVGDQLLHFSFLGTKTVYKAVTSGNEKEIDLGNIRMESSSQVLTEVEVKADFIPIEINKDTITYNADAFRTQPDAVVEDLLKKMPGIEVQNDGSIKAQGENVEKVLVDGKEFFGDDPKAATKNLPARAIKKVKVYDKKSDIAEFTGVDDGERQKTIDLQLREEFKKGFFGKAEAGYGSDEKYNAKASLNRFSKTLQLSFLGQYNNINQQGFSFSDRVSFAGNRRSGDYVISSDIPWEDIGNGLINTSAAGLNIAWQKNKNFSIRSSYFYNNVDKSLLQTSLRQNLSEIPFDTEKTSDESTINQSHRLAFNSEIKPDSTQEINLGARLSFSDGDGQSLRSTDNFIPGIGSESTSFDTTSQRNDNISLNANATYVRRFGNKGQNIATTFYYTINDTEANNTLQALTHYYNTGSTELLDQLQYSVSDNTNWSVHSSFTQPLNKRRFLELSYIHNELSANYDRQVLDIEGNTGIVNPALSNVYSSLFVIKKPGINFLYNGESKNANVSLQYQFSELTGFGDGSSEEIIKQYKHFLPRVVFRNDLGNGKNLRMSYSTRINPPSITQLSPVTDNSDPLKLYIGNPDLEAEYYHYANINYHSFTQFTSTNFFLGISGSLADDRIITSRSIDAQGVETSFPLNIDREWTASGYASFGKPVKFIHSRFNTNVNVGYTNTQNVINNELLDVDRWSRSGGLSFSSLNSQVVEYSLGGQWTFMDSDYKSENVANSNTITHNYYVNGNITFLKKWKLYASYSLYLYTSPGLPNQSLPLLKASFSRYILPNDRGQIMLSVFDLLDENRGLSRTTDINYLEEIRSNSVGRYFMLSFHYNVRGHGEEARGMRRMH